MRLNIEHLVNMIISGEQNKNFRPNLDINLSCLSVRVLVSHQKSTLFVKANYGWILDFKVSIGQPFRPKLNVTDFLPILRIIFVSLGCNFIIFGGNFHSDYWSAHPLNRLYWQHEGPMLSYFCCLCVMFYYP